MKLIVGLGNSDTKYDNTRHNIGFFIVDHFAQGHDMTFSLSSDLSGLTAKGTGLLLLKPATYMNLSGESVGKTIRYFKIEPDNIFVIHDDLDLAFGQMKIQRGKSAAGHHGVESIISHIGTDNFWRVRIGIDGPSKKNIPSDKYVLAKFTAEEKNILTSITSKAMKALEICISDDPDKAAQIYNQNTENDV